MARPPHKYTSDRWERIESVFSDALERPLDERSAYLRAVCGDDQELYREVESLLSAGVNSMLDGNAMDAMDAVGDILDPAASDEAPAADLSMEGVRVGPYKIVGTLGSGGMGSVYRAERADGQFEQSVALKLVKRGMDTEAVIARFQSERQILARLAHPNIARLLDGGVHGDGRPWFALEHIEGETITDYCTREGLSVKERVRLFQDVCAAVAYAHRNLVVHRDLKPSNILVSEHHPTRETGATTSPSDAGRPVVKLLDFGIAKLLVDDEDDMLTRTGERVLTPAYGAPEQRRGEGVTTATDVYGLGVVLYELLTGKRPDQISHVPHGEVPGPSAVTGDKRLRGDLDTIVATALREEPDRRYASAEGLLADLRAWQANLPIAAQPESASYRLRKYAQRHRAGVAWTAVAVVAGAFVITFYTVQLAAERDRARLEAQKSEQVSSFLKSLFAISDPRESGGEQISARQLLDRGAERIDEELGGQPAVRSEMLQLMGEVYANLGSYEQSETLLDEALRLRNGGSLDDAASRSETLVALGLLYERQGRYAQAEQTQQQAVDLLHAQARPDPLLLADALHSLAFTQLRQGRYGEGEVNIREALDLKRGVVGDDDPAYAYSLNILGDLLTFQRRYDEAEAVHRQALEMRRRHLGDAHLDVAYTLHNLGATLRDADRFAESEAYYREAVAVWRRHYGYDHQESANTLSQLAFVIGMQGRFEESDSLHNASMDMALGSVGPDHPKVAAMHVRHGDVLTHAGRIEEAAASYQRGVDTQRRVLGEAHPTVTRWQLTLARLRIQLGQAEEARRLIELSAAQCEAGGSGAFSGCTERVAAARELLGG